MERNSLRQSPLPNRRQPKRQRPQLRKSRYQEVHLEVEAPVEERDTQVVVDRATFTVTTSPETLDPRAETEERKDSRLLEDLTERESPPPVKATTTIARMRTPKAQEGTARRATERLAVTREEVDRVELAPPPQEASEGSLSVTAGPTRTARRRWTRDGVPMKAAPS